MVRNSTKVLFTEYLEVVKKALTAKLRENIGDEFEFSQDMDELFDTNGMFAGLDSEHEQRAYYLGNFNLVVRVFTLVLLTFYVSDKHFVMYDSQ